MDEKFVLELARSLQWTHSKVTTGTAVKWGTLNEDEQKLWRRMAQQALRRITEAQANASDKPATGGSLPEDKPEPTVSLVMPKPHPTEAAKPGTPVFQKPPVAAPAKAVKQEAPRPSMSPSGASTIARLLNIGIKDARK